MTLIIIEPNIDSNNGKFEYYFRIKPIHPYKGWQIKNILIDGKENYDNIDILELLNSAHNSLFTCFDVYKCLDKPCPYFSEEYTHDIKITTRKKLDIKLQLELLNDVPSLKYIPFWNLKFDILMRSADRNYIVLPSVKVEHGKKIVSYEIIPNPWFDD